MTKKKKIRLNLKYKKDSIMSDPIQIKLIESMVKNGLQFDLVEETKYDDGTESATIKIHFRPENLSVE